MTVTTVNAITPACLQNQIAQASKSCTSVTYAEARHQAMEKGFINKDGRITAEYKECSLDKVSYDEIQASLAALFDAPFLLDQKTTTLRQILIEQYETADPENPVIEINIVGSKVIELLGIKNIEAILGDEIAGWLREIGFLENFNFKANDTDLLTVLKQGQYDDMVKERNRLAKILGNVDGQLEFDEVKAKLSQKNITLTETWGKQSFATFRYGSQIASKEQGKPIIDHSSGGFDDYELFIRSSGRFKITPSSLKKGLIEFQYICPDSNFRESLLDFILKITACNNPASKSYTAAFNYISDVLKEHFISTPEMYGDFFNKLCQYAHQVKDGCRFLNAKKIVSSLSNVLPSHTKSSFVLAGIVFETLSRKYVPDVWKSYLTPDFFKSFWEILISEEIKKQISFKTIPAEHIDIWPSIASGYVEPNEIPYVTNSFEEHFHALLTKGDNKRAGEFLKRLIHLSTTNNSFLPTTMKLVREYYQRPDKDLHGFESCILPFIEACIDDASYEMTPAAASEFLLPTYQFLLTNPEPSIVISFFKNIINLVEINRKYQSIIVDIVSSLPLLISYTDKVLVFLQSYVKEFPGDYKRVLRFLTNRKAHESFRGKLHEKEVKDIINTISNQLVEKEGFELEGLRLRTLSNNIKSIKDTEWDRIIESEESWDKWAANSVYKNKFLINAFYHFFKKGDLAKACEYLGKAIDRRPADELEMAIKSIIASLKNKLIKTLEKDALNLNCLVPLWPYINSKPILGAIEKMSEDQCYETLIYSSDANSEPFKIILERIEKLGSTKQLVRLQLLLKHNKLQSSWSKAIYDGKHWEALVTGEDHPEIFIDYQLLLLEEQISKNNLHESLNIFDKIHGLKLNPDQSIKIIKSCIDIVKIVTNNIGDLKSELFNKFIHSIIKIKSHSETSICNYFEFIFIYTSTKENLISINLQKQTQFYFESFILLLNDSSIYPKILKNHKFHLINFFENVQALPLNNLLANDLSRLYEVVASNNSHSNIKLIWNKSTDLQVAVLKTALKNKHTYCALNLLKTLLNGPSNAKKQNPKIGIPVSVRLLIKFVSKIKQPAERKRLLEELQSMLSQESAVVVLGEKVWLFCAIEYLRRTKHSNSDNLNLAATLHDFYSKYDKTAEKYTTPSIANLAAECLIKNNVHSSPNVLLLLLKALYHNPSPYQVIIDEILILLQKNQTWMISDDIFIILKDILSSKKSKDILINNRLFLNKLIAHPPLDSTERFLFLKCIEILAARKEYQSACLWLERILMSYQKNNSQPASKEIGVLLNLFLQIPPAEKTSTSLFNILEHKVKPKIIQNIQMNHAIRLANEKKFSEFSNYISHTRFRGVKLNNRLFTASVLSGYKQLSTGNLVHFLGFLAPEFQYEHWNHLWMSIANSSLVEIVESAYFLWKQHYKGNLDTEIYYHILKSLAFSPPLLEEFKIHHSLKEDFYESRLNNEEKLFLFKSYIDDLITKKAEEIDFENVLNKISLSKLSATNKLSCIRKIIVYSITSDYKKSLSSCFTQISALPLSKANLELKTEFQQLIWDIFNIDFNKLDILHIEIKQILSLYFQMPNVLYDKLTRAYHWMLMLQKAATNKDFAYSLLKDASRDSKKNLIFLEYVFSDPIKPLTIKLLNDIAISNSNTSLNETLNHCRPYLGKRHGEISENAKYHQLQGIYNTCDDIDKILLIIEEFIDQIPINMSSDRINELMIKIIVKLIKLGAWEKCTILGERFFETLHSGKAVKTLNNIEISAQECLRRHLDLLILHNTDSNKKEIFLKCRAVYLEELSKLCVIPFSNTHCNEAYICLLYIAIEDALYAFENDPHVRFITPELIIGSIKALICCKNPTNIYSEYTEKVLKLCQEQIAAYPGFKIPLLAYKIYLDLVDLEKDELFSNYQAGEIFDSIQFLAKMSCVEYEYTATKFFCQLNKYVIKNKVFNNDRKSLYYLLNTINGSLIPVTINYDIKVAKLDAYHCFLYYIFDQDIVYINNIIDPVFMDLVIDYLKKLDHQICKSFIFKDISFELHFQLVNLLERINDLYLIFNKDNVHYLYQLSSIILDNIKNCEFNSAFKKHPDWPKVRERMFQTFKECYLTFFWNGIDDSISKEIYISEFVKIIQKLAEIDPERARNYVAKAYTKAPYLFNKIDNFLVKFNRIDIKVLNAIMDGIIYNCDCIKLLEDTTKNLTISTNYLNLEKIHIQICFIKRILFHLNPNNKVKFNVNKLTNLIVKSIDILLINCKSTEAIVSLTIFFEHTFLVNEDPSLIKLFETVNNIICNSGDYCTQIVDFFKMSVQINTIRDKNILSKWFCRLINYSDPLADHLSDYVRSYFEKSWRENKFNESEWALSVLKHLDRNSAKAICESGFAKAIDYKNADMAITYFISPYHEITALYSKLAYLIPLTEHASEDQQIALFDRILSKQTVADPLFDILYHSKTHMKIIVSILNKIKIENIVFSYQFIELLSNYLNALNKIEKHEKSLELFAEIMKFQNTEVHIKVVDVIAKYLAKHEVSITADWLINHGDTTLFVRLEKRLQESLLNGICVRLNQHSNTIEGFKKINNELANLFFKEPEFCGTNGPEQIKSYLSAIEKIGYAIPKTDKAIYAAMWTYQLVTKTVKSTLPWTNQLMEETISHLVYLCAINGQSGLAYKALEVINNCSRLNDAFFKNEIIKSMVVKHNGIKNIVEMSSEELKSEKNNKLLKLLDDKVLSLAQALVTVKGKKLYQSFIWNKLLKIIDKAPQIPVNFVGTLEEIDQLTEFRAQTALRAKCWQKASTKTIIADDREIPALLDIYKSMDRMANIEGCFPDKQSLYKKAYLALTLLSKNFIENITHVQKIRKLIVEPDMEIDKADSILVGFLASQISTMHDARVLIIEKVINGFPYENAFYELLNIIMKKEYRVVNFPKQEMDANDPITTYLMSALDTLEQRTSTIFWMNGSLIAITWPNAMVHKKAVDLFVKAFYRICEKFRAKPSKKVKPASNETTNAEDLNTEEENNFKLCLETLSWLQINQTDRFIEILKTPLLKEIVSKDTIRATITNVSIQHLRSKIDEFETRLQVILPLVRLIELPEDQLELAIEIINSYKEYLLLLNHNDGGNLKKADRIFDQILAAFVPNAKSTAVSSAKPKQKINNRAEYNQSIWAHNRKLALKQFLLKSFLKKLNGNHGIPSAQFTWTFKFTKDIFKEFSHDIEYCETSLVDLLLGCMNYTQESQEKYQSSFDEAFLKHTNSAFWKRQHKISYYYYLLTGKKIPSKICLLSNPQKLVIMLDILDRPKSKPTCSNYEILTKVVYNYTIDVKEVSAEDYAMIHKSLRTVFVNINYDNQSLDALKLIIEKIFEPHSFLQNVDNVIISDISNLITKVSKIPSVIVDCPYELANIAISFYRYDSVRSYFENRPKEYYEIHNSLLPIVQAASEIKPAQANIEFILQFVINVACYPNNINKEYHSERMEILTTLINQLLNSNLPHKLIYAKAIINKSCFQMCFLEDLDALKTIRQNVKELIEISCCNKYFENSDSQNINR